MNAEYLAARRAEAIAIITNAGSTESLRRLAWAFMSRNKKQGGC